MNKTETPSQSVEHRSILRATQGGTTDFLTQIFPATHTLSPDQDAIQSNFVDLPQVIIEMNHYNLLFLNKELALSYLTNI